MYSQEDILKFVNLVAEVVDPDRIILFGSYAYGEPTDNSDIDLLVIKNGKDITIDDETQYAVAIHRARRDRQVKPRYDVFFSTDSQAEEIASRGGAYVDALQKGKVIYERMWSKYVREDAGCRRVGLISAIQTGWFLKSLELSGFFGSR